MNFCSLENNGSVPYPKQKHSRNGIEEIIFAFEKFEQRIWSHCGILKQRSIFERLVLDLYIRRAIQMDQYKSWF